MIVFLQVYSFPLSPCLTVSIKFINTFFVCVCNMPNLDPWVNQYNNDYEDIDYKDNNKQF